ncbi:hypothetical protein [Streptomyces seoulensis]|nr:hypothetical protein [Streptomyces seoulensis]
MEKSGFSHYASKSQIAVQPVVLTRAAYDELFTAAIALLRLLRRALLESAPTAAGRIAALGADENMYPLVADGPHEEKFATCMTRPDVIVTSTGPKFLEFNIGSGFGGVLDTSLNSAAWYAAFGGPEHSPFRGIDPLPVRDALFQRVIKELDVEPAVAVVGTARDVEGRDAGRYFGLQVDSLREKGIRADFFEPEELLEGIGSPGALRYQLGLRHFTVPDWRDLGIDLSPVQEALDRGCLLIATQTAYLVANKKVLGWLSEGLPWMTDSDREIVDRYIPWTRVAGDRPTHWKGATYSLPELLVEHREEFILKPAAGMMSRDVFVGRNCEPKLWESAVDTAVATEGYIAQDYVEATPCRISFSDSAAKATFEEEVFPVFSPFIFGNRPGGCMVRHLPPGQKGIVGIHGHRSVAFAQR